MKSIQKSNLLDTHPVLVNSAMEVIDGQHRLEAARRLNVPFFFAVVEDADINTVMSLQTAKKWHMSDIIHRWVAEGNQNYVILQDFVEKYGLSPSTAKYLLGGVNYKSGTTDTFIAGKFKITQLKKASDFAEKYAEIKAKVAGKFAASRGFILALEDVFRSPNYDHSRMLRKLDSFSHRITPQDSRMDYIRELEDVYNYKEKESSKVRFL